MTRRDVQAEIEALVTSNPVVLFLKGTPDFPQCGFSARVVQVLARHAVEYEAVDVLADPDIRAGIKEYADWPTIPQLYVGGTFVGGCDIVLEMHENGELAKLLARANG
jgi:monothiol glutaredoxin